MAGKKRRKKPQPGRAVAVAAPPSRREARLLAKAGPDGVPAGTSLRHDRIGYALLGAATAAGIGVPAVLERCGTVHEGEQLIGTITGLVAACVLERWHSTGRCVGHGPDLRYVTARTLTGVRTVDLTALVRVRRSRMPGRRGWDELWLTDARGVSLRVDEKQVLERVAALLRPQDDATAQAGETVRDGETVQASGTVRDGGTATARVSHHAAVLLGLATRSRSRRVGRACVDVLVGLYAPGTAAGLGLLTTWLLATA
ncbi:hypothetical protein ACFZB9_09250 [Kitasatospora sp. NPDC008050]|uniref:hypothetical protein n=1 Tax=Kitasatospora sp. NPDC008050 TaxID=3364021 RepID=UPI0036EAA94B